MLAGLLLNLPQEREPSGGGGGHRRRPNEKVVWRDDWLKAQEELTAYEGFTDREKREVSERAIDEVKASLSIIPNIVTARDVLEESDDLLLEFEDLRIVLFAYFMLQSLKRREDNIAIMLALGVL